MQNVVLSGEIWYSGCDKDTCGRREATQECPILPRITNLNIPFIYRVPSGAFTLHVNHGPPDLVCMFRPRKSPDPTLFSAGGSRADPQQ